MKIKYLEQFGAVFLFTQEVINVRIKPVMFKKKSVNKTEERFVKG